MTWSREDILAAIEGEHLDIRDAEKLPYHELKEKYKGKRHITKGISTGSWTPDNRPPPDADYWKAARERQQNRPQCSMSDDGQHHGAWWMNAVTSRPGSYACRYCGATMEPPKKDIEEGQ